MSGRASAAIGLKDKWPKRSFEELGLRMKWAEAYLVAAEILFHQNQVREDLNFYAGPMLQNLGLASELTLKLVIFGSGKDDRFCKKLGHNTYDSYCVARDSFDELKFLEVVFGNLEHRSVPDEISQQMEQNRDEFSQWEWKAYFNHLRILDLMYDRPFLNRYIEHGMHTLPDAEIILVGTKLLLGAAAERLGHNISGVVE